MEVKYPKIYALNNRGIPGMDDCLGAPFIARDFETAKNMVIESVKDVKDVLDLSKFELIEIGEYAYTGFRDNFIFHEYVDFIIFPVSELFYEDPGDVAPSVPGCDEGIMTGVGFYDDVEGDDEKA